MLVSDSTFITSHLFLLLFFSLHLGWMVMRWLGEGHTISSLRKWIQWLIFKSLWSLWTQRANAASMQRWSQSEGSVSCDTLLFPSRWWMQSWLGNNGTDLQLYQLFGERSEPLLELLTQFVIVQNEKLHVVDCFFQSCTVGFEWADFLNCPSLWLN